MNNKTLKKISPQVLTQFVSFHRDNIEWQYSASERSTMQSKQAEGAAHLFNLLNEKRVALLADEVGMGKTIQALSVMAALWNQKPDAKILILAPRYEIAKNWENEYGTFINVHYKLNDDKVKTRYGNKEINPAFFCENLYDLVDQYSELWKKLFIGKISSFSSLFSKEDIDKRMKEIGIEVDSESFNVSVDEDKIIPTEKIGNALREKLTELAEGNAPFDLMIIDEAHYFRNKNGDSLRAHAAQSFFGTRETGKIADRVLMLTATPNHTSSANINAIFSYFNESLEHQEYQDLLDNYSIRRFRRLTKKGYMKYNYREEIPLPATFEDNPMSELFFGLYQKKLANAYLEEVNVGKKNRMLNFLEGTEFIPKPEPEIVLEELNESNINTDFNSGTDKDILIKISESYKSIFQEYPAHPKYDILIKALIPSESNLKSLIDKSLVFVRRIPSVREIAGRVNYEYDTLMLLKITDALGLRNSKLTVAKLGRKEFVRLIDKNLGKDTDEQVSTADDEDQTDNANNENIGFYGSKIMDLFKIVKTERPRYRSTYASNFRVRFSKSKPGIFPIFFAPGSDYFDKDYEIESVYKSNFSSDKTDDNFFATCLDLRTEQLGESDTAIKLKNLLRGKETKPQKEKLEESCQIRTLLTVFWNYLAKYDNEKFLKYQSNYQKFKTFEKEAFSKFIEKGILLASSGIVELFAIYLKVQKKTPSKSRLELYQNYINQLEKEFGNTVLPDLIIQSIETFKLIVEKVFNIRNEEELVNYEWRNFFDAQPAYPYWGDTKNERVILCFNTPFFPNVLISTSVLQEGVNLQYFCKNIIHYGIAWTPGDNEQRVGRVDRMFGKIENELNVSDKATLNICYPYLKDTIDQDHIADFIYKKYSEEERIDRCHTSAEIKKLNYADLNVENWGNFFRSPVEDRMENKDPYGVNSVHFEGVKFDPAIINSEINIKKQIIQTLHNRGLNVLSTSRINDHSSEVCIIDEELINDGKTRKQPIFMEVCYNPFLSGLANERIYVLEMKTPLGVRKKLYSYQKWFNNYKDVYQQQYLNTKICIDDSQSKDSSFFIYMKTEIPLFPDSNFSELSEYEIVKNIYALMESADYVEQSVFGKNQDLDLDNLQFTSFKHQNSESQKPLRSENNMGTLNEKWQIKDDYAFLIKECKTENKPEFLWRANHYKPLIRFISSNNKVYSQLAFLRNDLQIKESQLLEKIFDNQYLFCNKSTSNL